MAIDDHELHHLRVLLKDIFPEKDSKVITIVHNPSGQQGNNFSTTHEYAVILFPKDGKRYIAMQQRDEDADVRNFRDVTGDDSLRAPNGNTFYPVFVRDGKITGFGEVCSPDFHPGSPNIERPDGTIEIYPVDPEGVERKWRFARQTVDSIADELRAKFIKRRKVWDIERVKDLFNYKTVWSNSKYSANNHGTQLLNNILGDSLFSYPKSLYAVEECLRAVVNDKPDALILDFFAGSGTTLHATLLLNAEDGGNRRCVLVTNNEVSETEEKALAKKGFKPGDEEWEREGICRAVTIPRCKFAINGERDDGTPLPGTYLGGRALSEGFEANLQAFSLDFLDPLGVERGGKFADIAPILWLMAGARGELISADDIADKSKPYLWPAGSQFLVCLHDERMGETLTYLRAMPDDERTKLRHVFIVTNAREAWSEWRAVLTAMMPGIEVHQLYRDYLENYRLGENRRITDESLVGSLDQDTE